MTSEQEKIREYWDKELSTAVRNYFKAMDEVFKNEDIVNRCFIQAVDSVILEMDLEKPINIDEE